MDDETTPKAKVKNIAEAREKKKGKGAPDDAPPKIPIAVFFQAVADAMNGLATSTLPPFPVRFGIYCPTPSGRSPVAYGENGVLTLLENLTSVDEAILGYVDRELGNLPTYRWTASQVEACRARWVLSSDSRIQDEVKQVLWASDPGLCFNRLPWDYSPAEALPPTWDTLLGRASNRRAFCAWIGSLFYEESYGQQYAFLYGKGGEGKSAIGRFLAQVFGGAACSKDVPARGDKFWAYELIGKRLVMFPDCKQTDFVSSNLFKRITGGDPINVEGKGLPSFTYRPRAKCLFISNNKPRISSEESDRRRLIYCEFSPRPSDEDPAFEMRLWEEGGAFLSFCIGLYCTTCPDHRRIPVEDLDKLDTWLSVVEEDFEVIYERHFCRPVPPLDTVAGLQAHPLERLGEVSVSASRMREILACYFGHAYRANTRGDEFRKWLENKYSVRKQQVRFSGDHRPRVYVGIAEKLDSRLAGLPPNGRL